MNNIEKINNDAVNNAVTEINRLHLEIKQAMETAFQKALKLGELLTGVKAVLPHGEFGRWIEDNCNFSIRAGQRYIKLNDEKQFLLENGINSLAASYKLISGKSKYDTVSHLKSEDSSTSLDIHEENILDVEFEEIDENKELTEAYQKIDEQSGTIEKLQDEYNKLNNKVLQLMKEKDLEDEQHKYSDLEIDAMKQVVQINGKNTDFKNDLKESAELSIAIGNSIKFFNRHSVLIETLPVSKLSKELLKPKVEVFLEDMDKWIVTVKEKFEIES